MSLTLLGSQLEMKNMTLRNRIVMPPMCMYCVEKKDGIATDWHVAHYASRAIGGAGLIIVEATAILPEGRISDGDLGLWNDEQIEPLRRIVDAVHAQGCKIVLQINHAGRKAEDAPTAYSSSAIPISYMPGNGGPEVTVEPVAMTTEQAKQTVQAFADTARRAIQAGFDSVEVHAAHGYLIHQFHSPGLDQRNDEFGKDLSLFGCEVIRAVKKVIPSDAPLFVRMSAVEFMNDGYDLSHSLALAEKYRKAGADVFDISAGGEAAPGKNKPGNYPGYMLPYAQEFKKAFPQTPVIAVGMLNEPAIADYVVSSGLADLAAVGRGMLNDPYWAIHALLQQGCKDVSIPKQYQRGIR